MDQKIPDVVRDTIDWSDEDAGIPTSWREKMVYLEDKLEAAWAAIVELQEVIDQLD